MTQFYMTYSEVNREFKILHTSHKKAFLKIILDKDLSHFNFIEKYPLKFHSNYEYLVSYRAASNYFNK